MVKLERQTPRREVRRQGQRQDRVVRRGALGQSWVQPTEEEG